MAVMVSSRFVMQGIGCTLILLLELSAQAIDYEVYIHDATPMKLENDVVLTSRDLLERFDFITPKTSYTLQEGTEYWLHFGALLRAQILDMFGNLLYIHYDDFSVTEVDALHRVYQTILERRYHIFNLIPDILRSPNTRPSRICAMIYAHADLCLRDSASVCHRIRKHHDRSHPNLDTAAFNITHLVYRSLRMSRYYPKGFSLSTLLKYLHRGTLTITPGLLSGLLHNARYDSFDDIRLAERELVRYFNEIAQLSRRSVAGIFKPLSVTELKRFHSADSFLKYYIGVHHVERFPDDELKRHAFLIARHIVDVGRIDENIHLLGNVYENGMIHIEYLFNLVLPDDVLHKDVIEAKKYLAKKLDQLDVLERYLKIQKYQQTTPAELTMEITEQLNDIGFVRDVATALRTHARFWRKSRMIESLDELLMLFDAYENLRRVPRYRNMMESIDRIRESLWDTRDVPVEILCNAPRACLRIGLQTVLQCRFVSPEIKALVRDFLNQVTFKGALLDECLFPPQTTEPRRAVDISFKKRKVRLSTTASTSDWYPKIETKTSTTGIAWVTGVETTNTEMTTVGETTPRTIEPSTTEESNRSVTTMESLKSYESKETMESTEASNETAEELSTETTSEENTEFASTTKMTERMQYNETTEPILTTTTSEMTLPHREETTAATESTVATTTNVATTTTTSPTTTTTEIPSTMRVTTIPPTTTTTIPSTTITTAIPSTMTTTTISSTTASPTIITTLPTSTTTRTTTTATSPTTTVTMPSTIMRKAPTLDMEMILRRSRINASVFGDESLQTEANVISENSATFVTTTSKSCESGECNGERSSEETDKHETLIVSTTQASSMMVEENVALTTTPTMQASILVETTQITQTNLSGLSSMQEHFVTNETIVAKSSEAPVTKGEGCTELSCSKECTTSIETSRCTTTDCSGKSCSETDCDSLTTDCDSQDGVLEESPERPENRTVRCSRKRCEKESSEISSECETENSESCRSSECMSKDDEESAECVKLCVTRERNSCENQDDCSSAERPTIDVKFEHIRNRSMCEIRDPHHRRQLKRLAKMRAISAATSRTNVPILRTSRERIATKELYSLLAARLPRFKNDKPGKTRGYLPKRSLVLNSIEAGGGKDRKQRDQVYRLRKELARRLGRKSKNVRYRSRRTPLLQTQNKRISRKDAKLMRAARERAISDRNAI